MRLAKAVPALAALQNADVSQLSSDSRSVQPGALFFALPGSAHDGTAFGLAALEKGALAVVSDRPAPSPRARWISVGDLRGTLADACRAFYRRDETRTRFAAVTGTNGKTTITHLFEAIANAAGCRVGVIGTIEQRVGSTRWPSTHTTPNPIELCERLIEMERLGVDWVVLEVSSHGLDQKRVDPLRFDVAGFTNLTPDHLDYHGNMNAYFEAKSRLFRELLKDGGTAAINLDSEYGPRLADAVPSRCRRLVVSRQHGADVRVELATYSRKNSWLEIATPERALGIESRLIGEFNVENVAVAVGMAIGGGFAAADIERGIEQLRPIPGRLEQIASADGRVGYVDYAHTPDALDRALRTLASLPHERLWCVFSCGGDRDRAKRPLMGAAAARHADVVILTSDNPRSEAPEAILAEIVPGLEGAERVSVRELGHARQRSFAVIVDRRAAIEAAAQAMGQRDLLLVAGKGHETYQIIGSHKSHFDDREELRAAFAERA